jgi:hypothetical protein
MLKINIRTKPIEKMRTRDVGDYYQAIVPPGAEEEPLKIIVARMENPDYEFLVALHEMIEAYLIKRRGIDPRQIDEWEDKFEREVREGKRPKNSNAGEQKDCLYKEEHKIAIKIEKTLAKYLKINWKKYEKYLDQLIEGK